MYTQLSYTPSLNLWKHDFSLTENLQFQDLINNIKIVKVRYEQQNVLIPVGQFPSDTTEISDFVKFEFVDYIGFDSESTDVSVDYTFERKIDRLDLDISSYFEDNSVPPVSNSTFFFYSELYGEGSEFLLRLSDDPEKKQSLNMNLAVGYDGNSYPLMYDNTYIDGRSIFDNTDISLSNSQFNVDLYFDNTVVTTGEVYMDVEINDFQIFFPINSRWISLQTSHSANELFSEWSISAKINALIVDTQGDPLEVVNSVIPLDGSINRARFHPIFKKSAEFIELNEDLYGEYYKVRKISIADNDLQLVIFDAVDNRVLDPSEYTIEGTLFELDIQQISTSTPKYRDFYEHSRPIYNVSSHTLFGLINSTNFIASRSGWLNNEFVFGNDHRNEYNVGIYDSVKLQPLCIELTLKLNNSYSIPLIPVFLEMQDDTGTGGGEGGSPPY